MGFRSSGSGLECCFAIPFLGVWTLMMVRSLRFYWQEAPEALRSWAAENGYELVRQERRDFRRGPNWNRGRAGVVYRVAIKERDGRQKSGWVWIGKSLWLTVNELEVRWDEPAPPPQDGRGSPLMWDRELDS